MAPVDGIKSSTSLATAYSQLAGVLAGFAFVALASYLVADRGTSAAPHHRVRGDRIAGALFSAFASLVLVAVLFALITGEQDGTPRANAGLLVVGLPFGLAIVTMFYAMTMMAIERGMVQLARVGRYLVVFVGPTVVYSRLNNGIYILSPDVDGSWSPHKVGWILLGVIAAFGLVLVILSDRVVVLKGAGGTTANAALVLSIVSAAVAAVLVAQPTSYNPGATVLHRAGTVMALFLLMFSLFAASGISAEFRRADDPATVFGGEGSGESSPVLPAAPSVSSADRSLVPLMCLGLAVAAVSAVLRLSGGWSRKVTRPDRGSPGANGEGPDS